MADPETVTFVVQTNEGISSGYFPTASNGCVSSMAAETKYSEDLLRKGRVDISRNARIVNNPVQFINTLSERRPEQGRVFPIVR